jgi:hypothetical protein
MTSGSVEKYVSEAVEYICHVCDERFFYLKPQTLVCPKCGSQDPERLMAYEVIENYNQDD